MAEAIKSMNPKIEKILKMIQTNQNYCVGDKLTFADVDVFAWKLMLEDPTFNQYGDLKSSYNFLVSLAILMSLTTSCW